jgi:alpha-beta hydrolase superfamily lysophospholipase
MKIQVLASGYVRIVTFLLFFGCLLQGCMTPGKDRVATDSDSITTRLNKVKEDLGPLNFQTPLPFSESTHEYFNYYGLEIGGVEHIFGTFRADDKILAAHIFKPKESQGTVILLHGYGDHTGVWKHVISTVVKEKYTVAVYDHPGHGLSSGAQASIDDFSEYVAVLEVFLRIARAHLPGPYHLVAHSMGGAVTLDYLLTVDQPGVEKIILIAPLVHSSYWHLSRFGHSLGKHVTDSVPRASQNAPSDVEYLMLTEKDPLQARQVTMKWFSALVEWNQRILSYEPSTLPMRVIQGTADTAVDWQYNFEFIKEKFPNADFILIENGGHQLMNASFPMRAEVMNLVVDYLKGKAKQ